MFDFTYSISLGEVLTMGLVTYFFLSYCKNETARRRDEHNREETRRAKVEKRGKEKFTAYQANLGNKIARRLREAMVGKPVFVSTGASLDSFAVRVKSGVEFSTQRGEAVFGETVFEVIVNIHAKGEELKVWTVFDDQWYFSHSEPDEVVAKCSSVVEDYLEEHLKKISRPKS